MSRTCALPDSGRRQAGFSLVEIAIVLMILGALLGGLVLPLSSQQEASRRRATEKMLEEVRDALVGFAASTGRLPCPATTTSNGLSAPNTATTSCTTNHGFVPVRTLGIEGPTNANNLLVDRWLNPVRYSLSDADGGAYSNSIPLNLAPDFEICPDSTCTTPLADAVVAVVFSQADDTSGSADQNENTDGDARFVSRTIIEAAGSEFDDELRWLSPNTLVYQLVRAGQLN